MQDNVFWQNSQNPVNDKEICIVSVSACCDERKINAYERENKMNLTELGSCIAIAIKIENATQIMARVCVWARVRMNS